MILTMSSISWKLVVEVEVRRKGELAANLVEKRMISCPLQSKVIGKRKREGVGGGKVSSD